jgi:hypothetical protein
MSKFYLKKDGIEMQVNCNRSNASQDPQSAKNNNGSPQRRRDRRECNYIFLLRGQEYINCHLSAMVERTEESSQSAVFFFRPLSGKQDLLTLSALCASSVDWPD